MEKQDFNQRVVPAANIPTQRSDAASAGSCELTDLAARESDRDQRALAAETVGALMSARERLLELFGPPEGDNI